MSAVRAGRGPHGDAGKHLRQAEARRAMTGWLGAGSRGHGMEESVRWLTSRMGLRLGTIVAMTWGG